MFEIRVPATSANLGPGFDCLGFALKLYNSFKIERIESGINTSIIEQPSGRELALSLEENLFYHAIKKIYDMTGNKLNGIKLTETVNIPFARGLGSSATAVVAGLYAGNRLLNHPFNDDQIIDLAVEMEGHPDNVLPAIRGGFVINVMTESGLVYKKIEIDNNIKLVVVIPDFKLKTEDVRKILPLDVPYSDAVFNLSRTALLVSCFQENDFSQLKVAMEDKLHQDYRSELIPGFHQVIEKAYSHGALGVALSGAGPSMLAISEKNEKEIGQAMVNVFLNHNINSEFIVINPDNKGCIISRDIL
ncbi:MAG: homoserine kinase [Halanaerobiales bacterium]